MQQEHEEVRERNIREREQQNAAMKRLKDRVRRAKARVDLMEMNKRLRKELHELKQVQKVSGFSGRKTLIEALDREREEKNRYKTICSELNERVEELESNAGPMWLQEMQGPKVLRLTNHTHTFISRMCAHVCVMHVCSCVCSTARMYVDVCTARARVINTCTYMMSQISGRVCFPVCQYNGQVQHPRERNARPGRRSCENLHEHTCYQIPIR